MGDLRLSGCELVGMDGGRGAEGVYQRVLERISLTIWSVGRVVLYHHPVQDMG